jgi:integrase
MVDEGLSPATIKAARQVLYAVLEQAVTDGRIPTNPVAKMKPPPVRPRRQRFLTADQIDLLADAAEKRQPGAGALILFLAYSGVRWGEAVALRVGAVHLERSRVRIRESATEVGGHLSFGSPKTHQTRTVIIPRFVADRLSPHIRGKPPDGLVFTTPRGGPLRASNFRRIWQQAVTDVGLPKDLKIHDLRDTAASLMISAGASIKAVQRQLGHASAAMTLDVYASLFEEDLEALAVMFMEVVDAMR